jgi:hypothetical protein
LACRVDAPGVETPVKWPLFATFWNPEGAMADQRLSLAELIRNKLDAGLLPRILPDKMLTGYGDSGPCDGCDQPIYPPQVEYKFAIHQESGRLFRLHIGCVGMWLAELRRRGLVKPA